jgi:hypothetical protein
VVRAVGCDPGQGYFVSRPVRADAVPDLLGRSWAGYLGGGRHVHLTQTFPNTRIA